MYKLKVVLYVSCMLCINLKPMSLLFAMFQVALDGLKLEQVPVHKLGEGERSLCNLCATSIPDVHRYCSGCQWELCVSCCAQQRQLQQQQWQQQQQAAIAQPEAACKDASSSAANADSSAAPPPALDDGTAAKVELLGHTSDSLELCGATRDAGCGSTPQQQQQPPSQQQQEVINQASAADTLVKKATGTHWDVCNRVRASQVDAGNCSPVFCCNPECQSSEPLRLQRNMSNAVLTLIRQIVEVGSISLVMSGTSVWLIIWCKYLMACE